MKQKEYEHFYEVEHSKAPTMRMWLKLLKAWRYGFQLKFGIVKRRHRRSFISCRLPKIVGNRIIYRLFKATRWFKEPNIKYMREEKNYEKTKTIYLQSSRIRY